MHDNITFIKLNYLYYVGSLQYVVVYDVSFIYYLFNLFQYWILALLIFTNIGLNVPNVVWLALNPAWNAWIIR